MESLFQDCSYNPRKNRRTPAASSKIGNKSEMDLKLIEKQLNQYLQQEKGRKSERVILNNYRDETAYNEETFAILVEDEVKRKYQKKKWGSLPKFFQWQLVQKYAQENNIDVKEQRLLKKKVEDNNLEVEYDIDETRIISIL